MQKEPGTCSIVKENPVIPGCTVSGEILSGVQCFSLARGTDISAESYPVAVLQYNLAGQAVLRDIDTNHETSITSGEIILKPANHNIGVKATDEFKLKELVPYQDGKIVNMDIASNDHMKFVVMSFDEGTGLSEHAAPGEAIVFALDGNGIIGYEGKEYPIKAGEQFHFAKGGLHSVKADGQFKMALLLVLG